MAHRINDMRAGFGPKLGQVSRRWRALVDSRLKAYGLTEATWRPLLHLALFDRAPRQKDLAESLGIEDPSLVRLLDALEGEGLIVRRCDGDRRVKTIHITPRGEKLRRKIEAIVSDIRDQLLADISDEELAGTLRVLEKMHKRLDAKVRRPSRVRSAAGGRAEQRSGAARVVASEIRAPRRGQKRR